MKVLLPTPDTCRPPSPRGRYLGKSSRPTRAVLLIVLLAACGGSDPLEIDNVEGRACVDDSPEVPEAECIALVTLYANTNGPTWVDHTGWGESSRICSWFGVTCDNGHVTSLVLQGNGLSGPLPRELAALGAMTVLELADNELTGAIPSELGALASLQRLSLRDNQLTGTIPPQLANIPLLRALVLRNNGLSGAIPSALGNLTGLLALNLSGNQLAGSIPPELGNLLALRFLLLQDNQLEGVVPLAVADLGGRIQSSFAPNQCNIDGNPAVTMPDDQDYRGADRDLDGFICGVELRPVL